MVESGLKEFVCGALRKYVTKNFNKTEVNAINVSYDGMLSLVLDCVDEHFVNLLNRTVEEKMSKLIPIILQASSEELIEQLQSDTDIYNKLLASYNDTHSNKLVALKEELDECILAYKEEIKCLNFFKKIKKIGGQCVKKLTTQNNEMGFFPERVPSRPINKEYIIEKLGDNLSVSHITALCVFNMNLVCEGNHVDGEGKCTNDKCWYIDEIEKYNDDLKDQFGNLEISQTDTTDIHVEIPKRGKQNDTK